MSSAVEEEFLLAVERGDKEALKRFLDSKDSIKLNTNCRDPLDRDALVIAIDNRNVEMIKILLETDIKVGDALLYAIQDNFVEAVELLLDHPSHCDQQRQTGLCNDIYSEQSCFFSCDMTPLMLAAQKNNLEIIKLLLDRNVSPIPNPHDPRCGCDACCRARSSDCLRHSRSRINAYKALSSPSLMALSSPDPLASAFEMSARLEDLAKMEPEYKEDYMRLRAQCQAFATKLLDYTRTSKELEILLNFDGHPTAGAVQFESGRFRSIRKSVHFSDYSVDDSYRMTRICSSSRRSNKTRLARLKLAIQCKQKTFCAHPNIQELLATMWYENLPGFRRKNVFNQTLQVLLIGLMFPIYSIAYLLAPHSQFGSYIKKPFIKFICHSASYITFIIVLILASQRVEAFYEWSAVKSLFFSDRSLLDDFQRAQVQQQHQQQLQAGANYSATMSAASSAAGASDILAASADKLTLLGVTMNSPPPTGTYSDDSYINSLAALYKHTMGQATGGTGSTARGLDSLSKIFEELPASSKKRGTLPSPIESIILIWVLSLIWAELKQIKSLGINYYKDDMWNILDSIASGCYIGTIILRIVSYVQSDDRSLEIAREHWHAYDPTLLSEGLFATATIFSALKLVYIFSVNPYLGPLQISLGRMIIDILRFSWIYMLVLFAFACGMNQLLWYYADLERHQCLNVTNYNLAQYYKAKHNLLITEPSKVATADILAPAVNASISTSPAPMLNVTANSTAALPTNTTTLASNSTTTSLIANSTMSNATAAAAGNFSTMPKLHSDEEDFANMTDEKLMESAFSASLEDDSSMPPVTLDDSCKTWRHFSNVFESSQTLFWANFGLVDLENFDLTGIRQYTRFWALLMFGCYCFINVIVVLNLLIAMMNHSYVKISKRSDIEWKFARTRLWVSYFENGSTVPAPFNIIPSIKAIRYFFSYIYRQICGKTGRRFRSSAMTTTATATSSSLSRDDCELDELPGKSTAQYYIVMRSLVRRYLVSEQRQSEKRSGLTEAKLKRWSKLNVFT